MAMKQVTRGFTLIELMIVVVVIAILAAIAYPTYSHQVRKTARKEAAGIMLDTAARLERIRTQTFTYPDITPESTNRYTITMEVLDSGAGYLVTATPLSDQVDDRCGVITLNEKGGWVFTHQDGTEVPQSECL